MNNQKQNGSIIAIITMMFLYAMISFVTNLGAPIGVIWKNQPEIGGSNVLGIMGNFMNFFAYLFMGIPAGKMLTKVGYKKTALIGIAVGFIGVLIQFLSGFSGGITGFCIYLFGAFISGFAVCILNTVVNPMLNPAEYDWWYAEFTSRNDDPDARGCTYRNGDGFHTDGRRQSCDVHRHDCLRSSLCGAALHPHQGS